MENWIESLSEMLEDGSPLSEDPLLWARTMRAFVDIVACAELVCDVVGPPEVEELKEKINVLKAIIEEV